MNSPMMPKTAQIAIEWLKKMDIEVRPALISEDMYEFKYKDILMFITTDTNDNELFLSAPVFLSGKTDEENKNIFELAKNMCQDELKDYIVMHVTGPLSYVGQVYVRPKDIRTLRRYQLLHMLDEIVEIQYTFLTAIMIASAPIKDWMKDVDYEDLTKDIPTPTTYFDKP